MVNCAPMLVRAWLVVVLSLATVARAQASVPSSAETWGLKWNAPDGCLQAAELAERVERHAGRPLFVAQARRHLEGYLSADAPGTFRVRVTLLDDEGRVLGTRELSASAATCRELDERVVLVLALLIEPFTATPPSKPSAPPPAPPGPVSPPPEPPGPRVARPVAPASDGSLEVRGDERFSGRVRISQDRFYRLLGRTDLSSALAQRGGARTALFVVGGLSAALAAASLGVGLSNVGCVRFPGTPADPGACLERAPGWLVTAGVALVVAVATFIWGGALDARPTSQAEDEQLAADFNARRPVPVRF